MLRSTCPMAMRVGPAGEPQRGGPALANRNKRLLPKGPRASTNPGGCEHAQRRINCHPVKARIAMGAHQSTAPTKTSQNNDYPSFPPLASKLRAAPGRGRAGQWLQLNDDEAETIRPLSRGFSLLRAETPGLLVPLTKPRPPCGPGCGSGRWWRCAPSRKSRHGPPAG